jgi:hypothetical protein
MNATGWQMAHSVTQYTENTTALFSLKYRAVSRCTHKSKFIPIHNKSLAFLAPIFSKFMNAKQYYVRSFF